MITVSLIQPDVIVNWENGYTERISWQVNKNPEINKFRLVNNTADADLIVLLDSCTFKTQKNLKQFEKLLSLYQDNKRLCTLNYEDSPPGFLPGLYSSLDAYKFDPSIHLSWPHLSINNEFIKEVDLNKEPEPNILFTFSGACSNPLRRKLFNLYKSSSGKYKVKEVSRWYNHTENEKKSYVDDILQSKFVLCPPGLASYSHRIFETLALGRVPVVIADNWVPFSIPEKEYFIRIKESAITDVVNILEQKESEYEKLRANVTEVYKKYFAPHLCYSIALNRLTDFYTNQLINVTADYIRKRWNSRKFWKNNKWCIEDRVSRKISKLIKTLNLNLQ